jgi:hypothetical protein
MSHFTSDKQRYIPGIKRQRQALRVWKNFFLFVPQRVNFSKALPNLFLSWKKCLSEIKRGKICSGEVPIFPPTGQPLPKTSLAYTISEPA